MATPKWFNEVEYLSAKLAQVQSAGIKDPSGSPYTSMMQIAEAIKSTGMSTFEHYNAFGSKEGLAPSSMFNVQEYCLFKLQQLKANVDTKAEWANSTWQDVQYSIHKAGISLGQHYAKFGAVEGVSMSNGFDTTGYLTAKLALLQKNADTKAEWAGKTTTDLAKAFVAAGTDPYSHYMTYKGATGEVKADAEFKPTPVKPVGQPGQLYTLTTATGEKIVGTNGDDEVRGVAGLAEAAMTLNIGDTIDGGNGDDTLNLIIAGTAPVSAGVSVKNVEVVNLDVTASAADASFLKSSLYSGVEELWQVNTGAKGNGEANGSFTIGSLAASVASAHLGKYADVVIGEGVTAGFRGNNQEGTGAAAVLDVTVDSFTASNASQSLAVGTDAINVVTASDTQKVLSVALDGVGTGSALDFVGAKVDTINVSGSIAKASASAAGSLDLELTATTKTFNGEFTSGVKLVLDGAEKVQTLNFAKSTGGIEIDLSGTDAAGNFQSLKTVTFGSGADKVIVNGGNAEANQDITIDLGAGNDTVTLVGASGATNNGLSASGTTSETSITLGAGKDTVMLDATNFVISNIKDASAPEANGLIAIEDFKVGEDFLNLSAANAAYVNIGGAMDQGTKTVAAAAAAALTAAGAGKATIFGIEHADGTHSTYYVVDSTGKDGFSAGDGLIELAGVDVNLLVGSTSLITA